MSLKSKDRSQSLQAWYEAQAGVSGSTLTMIAGDASFRRYFRVVADGHRAVLCDSPPATEKNPEFLAIALALTAAGVRVPKIIHVDLERGFFALEDLGDQTLLPLLEESAVDAYYADAFEMLERLALADHREFSLPNYEYSLLAAELRLFPEWFCEGLLGLSLDGRARDAFQSLEEVLCERALAQPQVVVHRDFHARNLMVLEGGGLATIDFQDAVVGPISYDLVSLLRDCYLRWPVARVKDWALAYRRRLLDRGLALPEETDFLTDFDWIGLQRHIKVLGIFARLHLRDGKAAYLQDLPRVLSYVRDGLSAYDHSPALAGFGEWFEAQIVPLAEKQTWYVSPSTLAEPW